MTTRRQSVIGWVLTGVLSTLVLAWAFPRAYPLFPTDRTTSRAEAERIALEHLNDLGDLPERPYIAVSRESQEIIEARLLALSDGRPTEEIRASALADETSGWRVTVYDRREPQWRSRAFVTSSGRLAELLTRPDTEPESGSVDPEQAVGLARQFLAEQGLDPTSYGAPETISGGSAQRSELTIRFPDLQRFEGVEAEHGVEVKFAGERLTGFARYFDDPDETSFKRSIAPLVLLNQLWVFVALLLTPIVAIPFVRRYHQGEIGVERGVQLAGVVIGLGFLMLVFCTRSAAESWNYSVLTRPQTFWVIFFQLGVLFFVPMGILSLLSWSVGEAVCRERWSDKLAAFDAVMKGSFTNATVARASLRGFAAGLAILAATTCSLVLLQGKASTASFLAIGPWWPNVSWFSVPLVAYGIAYSLYTGLFGQLLIASSLVRALGRWPGMLAAAVLCSVLFFPLAFVFPMSWSLPLWFLYSLAAVIVFMRYGLFTTLMMHLTAQVGSGAVPFLLVDNASIQLQASLALLVVATPLILSVRYLFSEREFVYRYDDVPPHVRRIAQRERQKVELETARNIQTSILPELPPQIHGVELASSYLPATEVGGDFYDVLALEDGRLALAVGDVAGHGVSSGLVMSMAKSALAVQVTFDPEVEAVFSTLNRMVYQSARRRLLATLCYALLDPAQRKLYYASAGHLFPYRITATGAVSALESVSYPLGVRNELDVSVRAANLDSGDYLFLFSDGVVEARPQESDDLYGFDRLEESLRRHAGGSVAELRDGVLADLAVFTGGAPREDDLTVLALRLP